MDGKAIIWKKAQRSGAFDSFEARVAWNDLRAFVVDFLADVAAYRRLGDEAGDNPQGAASGTYIESVRLSKAVYGNCAMM